MAVHVDYYQMDIPPTETQCLRHLAVDLILATGREHCSPDEGVALGIL